MAGDAVVICGYGEVGREIVKNLGGTRAGDPGRDGSAGAGGVAYELPQVVAFDTEPSLINSILMPGSDAVVMYGDGENPEVLRSNGVENPRAIFVLYQDHDRVMAATSRLRTLFDRTPIYTRAQSRQEAQEFKSSGATEVVVELDELPRSSPYLLMAKQQPNGDNDGDDDGTLWMQNILNCHRNCIMNQYKNRYCISTTYAMQYRTPLICMDVLVY